MLSLPPKISRTVFAVSILAFFWSCGAVPSGAVGQNKFRTDEFDWDIKPIPHFDVYYYGAQGLALLPYSTRFLQRAYERVTAVLPADPKANFPIFIYNTHNEYEETNIADIGEGTGGVTEAFKDRLAVGHIGSLRALAYLLNHEFTHEIEYYYLFSGFWRSIQLLKFVFYPNWLMEGLAEYTTGEVDATEREMYLRDAATCGKLFPLDQLISFNHVMPHQVTLGYKESDGLMRYIADEYGQDKLPLLLAEYREKFDPSTVLQNIVGTDLTVLDKRFRESLEDKYCLQVSSNGLREPSSYGKRLTESGPYPRFYECAVFSPDGKKIAYVSDEQGYPEIYLKDLAGGSAVRLWDLMKSIKVEYVHTDGFGLSFSPDGRFLAFAGERRQKDHIYIVNLRDYSLRILSPGTDTVDSPAFSPDGKTIYFSGMKDGFRDLFACTVATGKSVRLTDDPGDNIDAFVSPNGAFLYYSTERFDKGEDLPRYHIFRMNLATGAQEAVTALTANARYPSLSPDGKTLYFTSDQYGILDIYALNLSSGTPRRLTRVVGGNYQPRVSPDGAALLFSSFRCTERHLYLMELSTVAVAAAEAPAVAAVNSTAGSPEAASPRTQKRETETDIATSSGAAVPPYARAGGSTVGARPYRFKASTDLFYPALFYSSVDGLYLAAYWQASEFLGNHLLAVAATYSSGAEYLDYQFTYGFLRYRPQFYFSATGEEYFYDIQRTIKRQEHIQSITTVYPLNRFQTLQFLVGTIDRREIYLEAPQNTARTRENIGGLAFIHDTTLAPYLETTSGIAFQASSQFSAEVFGGDYAYQDYQVVSQEFFPFGKQQTLMLRTSLGGSFGRDAELFRLGGTGRVRGVPDNDLFAGNKVFINTVEWRFPLVYNIDYHMWYFFPDFFFKTLYGGVFVDAGFNWNRENELNYITLDRWQASYGASLRLHTFILEIYYLMLNLQVAKPLNGGDPVLYLGINSSY